MPLDALSPMIDLHPLAALLDRHAINPVDRTKLEAHKQSQLRKFGPTFWYRHQQLLGVALLASVGCMALTAGAANAIMQPPSPVATWISMAWLCLMAMLIVSGVFTARAGSVWEERWLQVGHPESSGVPETIAATARSLQKELPGSTLVLGELIRGSVVLDPYLLLVHGEDSVCLGIWDDGGIIASAK